MAKVYYNLIKKGLITLDKVPAKWKTEVNAMLR